jgi:uncharacterized protein (DUF427 family)
MVVQASAGATLAMRRWLVYRNIQYIMVDARGKEPAMPKVTLNDVTLAESDKTEVVEGNHYFPPDSVKQEYLRESDASTHCPWKGDASYYTLEVEGEVVEDAAWFYPDPKEAAGNIKDYIAFYPGRIEIEA